MPSKTTLVDVTASGKWDVYIGRARVKTQNPKFRVSHKLTAPYFRHDGDPDWRDDAKDEYRTHLLKLMGDDDMREIALDLRGKRLGAWGEFGVEMGEVLVKVIEELK